MATLNDSILWQKFKSGDRQAFLTLYDQYFPVLFRYCRQITPDTQLIEDTIHDLFITLWNRRHYLGEVQSIQSYLITSARRLIVQQLKKDSGEELTDNLSTAPFELIIGATVECDLAQALQELNEKQREVLFLKFYNNLSYQEISEVMNLRLDTVYKIAKRSLGKLRKKLTVAQEASINVWLGMVVLAKVCVFEIISMIKSF